MKKLFTVLLALFALIAVDVDAKGFGGGSRSSFGGSRSSTPSRSFSTPKPAPKPAYVAPAPAPAPVVNKAVPSTFSKPAVATAAVAGGAVAVAATPTTPKAVSTNAIDTKVAKSTAITAPAYKTKAEAETAYRTNLASSNKYSTATPPATRPANIPEKVTVGGSNVTVVYNQMPGGGYGYGYTDPMTHMFVSLAATHMMVDAMAMNNHGYGYGTPAYPTQHVATQPVVVQQQPANGWSVLRTIIICVFVGGVLFFIVWFIVKAE